MEALAPQQDHLSGIGSRPPPPSTSIPLQYLGGNHSSEEVPRSEGSGNGSRDYPNSHGSTGADPRQVVVSRRDLDRGLVGLCNVQGRDPTHRMFAPYPEAACAVQWGLDQEIRVTYDKFCNAYMAGDESWTNHLKDLTEILPQSYAFANSRMGVETLPEPGKLAFQRVKEYFPHLKQDRFDPPGKSGSWKCVHLTSRQDEWARALPEGGPIRRFLSSCFKRQPVPDPESGLEPDLEDDLPLYYQITGLKMLGNILFTLAFGIFFSTPVVIIALNFAPRFVHIVLVVFFVLAFGCALSWWLKEPLLSVALMIAYTAALVSIDVGGS